VGPFLLDVNVLIALAWPDHKFHDQAGLWFERHQRHGWATCALSQSAFVRILSNPAFSSDALTPAGAMQVLERNLRVPGHHFWKETIPLHDAVKNCDARITGHQQVMDAYLAGLAVHHRGRLATLDKGIKAWVAATALEIVE
jgi:uncharacterized protein